MRTLDKKLFRDLLRLWAQSLAVALVMACGIATLIIGQGAHASLYETREAYYQRSGFADIFASAERAPQHLTRAIAAWPGVASVDVRVAAYGQVEVAGFELPITGRFLSLPGAGEKGLNRVTLLEGRMPEPGRTEEVLVNAPFAKAHGLVPGSALSVVIKGHRLDLRVSGIALSPEFIYTIGPGDMMPDSSRFGIFWTTEEALAGAEGLKGAFNDVSIALTVGANGQDIAEKLDRLLEPYGGTSATTRKDQISNAFLDAEMTQLATMSRILPPIFLVVTAFLINMILSRLIGLEREQIGLLKALGYGSNAIALHYVKLVLVIAFVGLVVGIAAGTWLGFGLTKLYQRFFSFPYLVFLTPTSTYAIAAAVSSGAALIGAFNAVYRAATLAPAVAMQPPAPPVYRKFLPGHWYRFQPFSQMTVMAFRHMLRWPWRATATSMGIAVSAALLLGSFFARDSVDYMLDITFQQMERQDVSIQLSQSVGSETMEAIRRLPGVIAAEPVYNVAVELENGGQSKRTGLIGRLADPDISRLIGTDLKEQTLPPNGIVLSKSLADSLHLTYGDTVHIKFFREGTREAAVPVTAIIEGYIGLTAYMELGALNKLLRQEPRITGAVVLLDPQQIQAFYRLAKAQPALSAIALQRVSLANFRKTLGENISIQIIVYSTLASTIAFGVVYNSARIQFSERARELASLRVLGFGSWEVLRIILVEFSILTALALPIGWLLGAGLAYAIATGFQSDLYRIPYVISPQTVAWSGLIVIAAVALSLFVVLRRVFSLDLISVLKTRD